MKVWCFTEIKINKEWDLHGYKESNQEKLNLKYAKQTPLEEFNFENPYKWCKVIFDFYIRNKETITKIYTVPINYITYLHQKQILSRNNVHGIHFKDCIAENYLGIEDVRFIIFTEG